MLDVFEHIDNNLVQSASPDNIEKFVLNKNKKRIKVITTTVTILAASVLLVIAILNYNFDKNNNSDQIAKINKENEVVTSSQMFIENEPEANDIHVENTEPEKTALTMNDFYTQPDCGSGDFFIAAFNVDEIKWFGPWEEGVKIDSLPVFKNNSRFPEDYETGKYHDTYETTLKEMALRFGFDMNSLVIEKNSWSEDQLFTKQNGITIEVDHNTIIVTYDNPKQLPDGMSWKEENESEENLLKVALYLKEEYKDILQMNDPIIKIDGGDRHFDGTSHLGILLYEGEAEDGNELDIVNQTINHDFNYVKFFNGYSYDGTENKITTIWFKNNDLSQKIADFPAITVEKAYDLLQQGEYISPVPVEYPLGTKPDKIYMGYQTHAHNKYFIPYYIFCVEQTEDITDGYEDMHKDLKGYNLFYVPAIDINEISKKITKSEIYNYN